MDFDVLMQWGPLLIGLLSLAALAGFLAGLLGIGGGLVLVPGLYFIFTHLGYDSSDLMHVAVGTSLATIIATGLSSARAHWKKGSVSVEAIKKIAPGLFLGVVIGTIIADGTPGDQLKLFFACALFGFALLMIANPAKYTFFRELPKQPWPSFAGAFIGSVSTLMGIGGAALNVPYMSLHNVPIHKAVGSASAMGLFIAVPGVIGFALIGQGVSNLPPYSFGYINLIALGIIIPVTVLVAPLGVAAAHKFSVKALRRIFSVFLIIVAIRMAADIWMA